MKYDDDEEGNEDRVACHNQGDTNQDRMEENTGFENENAQSVGGKGSMGKIVVVAQCSQLLAFWDNTWLFGFG